MPKNSKCSRWWYTSFSVSIYLKWECERVMRDEINWFYSILSCEFNNYTHWKSCNWNKGKKRIFHFAVMGDNNSFISQLVSHPSTCMHYVDYSFKIENMHALNNNAEVKIEARLLDSWLLSLLFLFTVIFLTNTFFSHYLSHFMTEKN